MLTAITITIWTSVLLLLLTIIYWFIYRNAKKEPPCPGWVPFFGSYFHIKEPLCQYLLEKYPNEPIVRLYFGTRKVFYLNTSDAVKEAFVEQGDKFLGRPQMSVMDNWFSSRGGVVMTEGQLWSEYRRFTIKTMKDFGVGRKGAEEIISEEIESLIKHINTNISKSFEPSQLLSYSAVNIISQIIFGSKLAKEDPNFKIVFSNFDFILQSANGKFTGYFLTMMDPVFKRCKTLGNILTKLIPFTREAMTSYKNVLNYCQEKIDEIRIKFNIEDEPSNFIESHLKHQAEHSEMFNDQKLTRLILDLFINGTDTTANTLAWSFLFMMENPEVMTKVHKEIHREIGTVRLPKISDKVNLQYVQATLEEVHRLATLAPEGIAHRSTEITTVAGYILPPNSLCFPNVYSIHRNPTVFLDAKTFQPERYLVKGQFSPNPDVMPFIMGKRSCLGESLARMELFLIFTAIMQRYKLQMASGQRSSQEFIDEAKQYGPVRVTDRYKIVFVPRDCS